MCLLRFRRPSFSRCAPLPVAIRFSASVKLVSSNLFSRHNGGIPEERVLAGGQRSVKEIARQAKQARPADSTEMAISQARATRQGVSRKTPKEREAILGFERRARGLRGKEAHPSISP